MRCRDYLGTERTRYQHAGWPFSRWSTAVTGSFSCRIICRYRHPFLLRRRLAHFRRSPKQLGGEMEVRFMSVSAAPYSMRRVLHAGTHVAAAPCDSTAPIEARPRNSTAAESSVRLTRALVLDHSAVQHLPYTNAINFSNSSAAIPHILRSVMALTAANVLCIY